MKAQFVSLDCQVPACDTSLSRLPVVVGSGPDATIRLLDHSISPSHCRIEQIDGEWVVSDLGSLHGTFVNGDQITQAALKPGDTRGIGMLTFFLRYTQADPDPVTPLQDLAAAIA
jgi:pSer/pThr/pTyr-binding forkhead associated (FHA) protein